MMSKWEGSKKGRESDKESILKSMVAQSAENVPFYRFSILILFPCSSFAYKQKNSENSLSLRKFLMK